jgi:CheY-like chemotaxis protein
MERVVQAAVDVVSPAASAKDIVVTAHPSGEATTVSGDPDRLQQVVWNLLSNAVKFTPRGGQVDIDVRRVDSRVRLTVKDSGAGIDPQFLPHAFEAFRQADSSATRRHGGLGLGLAIVRRLVELHGGTVRADSPGVGLGATFVIELPVPAVQPRDAATLAADTAASAGQEPTWASAPSLHGLLVLIAEDDLDSREVLQASLESLGAEVVLTTSVQEALERLRERRPDVVVSDIEMPDESGYELVKQMRDLPASHGGLVPAIALTAYARTEDRIKALAAGFQTHIAKPVHPVELAAAIAALTARTR